MKKIKVSDYIIQELAKLGIKNIFGVPGDYNFNLIDSVERNSAVKWIGSTNELNAGYAADGYSRLNGYGAVITTYGVGELSAINAIAGSFAESIPVVMLVGIPSSKQIEEKSYVDKLKQDGMRNFIKYGIACFKKDCKVVVSE